MGLFGVREFQRSTICGICTPKNVRLFTFYTKTANRRVTNMSLQHFNVIFPIIVSDNWFTLTENKMNANCFCKKGLS